MQYTRARENAFSAMAFRARRRRRRFAVRIADHVGGPREIKVAKRGVEVRGGSQYSIIDRTRIADERPANVARQRLSRLATSNMRRTRWLGALATKAAAPHNLHRWSQAGL